MCICMYSNQSLKALDLGCWGKNKEEEERRTRDGFSGRVGRQRRWTGVIPLWTLRSRRRSGGQEGENGGGGLRRTRRKRSAGKAGVGDGDCSSSLPLPADF